MEDRHPTISMVRVLNPNPRPLFVLDDKRVIDRLPEKGEGTYLVTENFRLVTLKGKSKVVLTGLGEWEDEQWIQDVGQSPEAVHPDKASSDA